MAYHIEENTGDLVIDGFEQGIASSPHKGIANMQSVNIDTETGEVMCSFARTQQSVTNSTATGSLAFVDTSHVSLSITASNNFFKGQWITVTSSTHTGELPNGDYYVLVTSGANFVLATSYNGSGLSGYTTGLTASFTLKKNMGLPVASATERYSDGTIFQFRYYVLDTNSLVWVYDTANDSTASGVWFLPVNTSTPIASGATGIAVLGGVLFIFSGINVGFKFTVNLGASFTVSSLFPLMSNIGSPNPHFAFVGHQGKMYYTDGNYIGSIFPDTSLVTGVGNIQSYAKWTAPTSADNTKGTVSVLISGSLPFDPTINKRIPAVFFPTTGGTLPSALSASTTYYIAMAANTNTFTVFSAITGGSALDITTGSSGVQYYNTFYPVQTATTVTITPQRLNLPEFEVAQSIAELGDIVIIGTKSNYLYPWNQVDVTPSDLIPLPENGATYLLTVNNMVYVLAGNKGNVYITNGSTASRALSIPDYCAGIAGTPSSYIEPYFTWGGMAYVRGRVYCSILDQTASKAGNCGGIWSFLPTQNMFIGQDVGQALRLENQSSYGTYNGFSPVIIAAQTQNALGTQYWSGWESSISSPAFGIDFTSSTPSTSAIIETDLIPIGTMLNKQTQKQVEYKLAAPADEVNSVAINFRLNATDAFVSCGTANTEGPHPISGYYTANFENAQWLQLQVVMTPDTSSNSSFIRLSEIRIR